MLLDRMSLSDPQGNFARTYPPPSSLVTGEVYAWGSGIYGQLGHGNMRDRFSPLMVGSLRQIGVTLVACHEYHSAAVAGELEIARATVAMDTVGAVVVHGYSGCCGSPWIQWVLW